MIYFLFVLLSGIPAVSAQQKDTLSVLLVQEKKVLRIKKAQQRISMTELPSLQLSSLNQLLEMQSQAFIKNYGIGSLSTLSIRGASAAQTNTNWQGIPLNNVLSGITDFSLIPSFLFDQITIDYGNQPLSQSVAGDIHLITERPDTSKSPAVQGMFGAESLRNLSLGLKVQQQGKQLSHLIRSSFHTGQNHYRYYDPEKKIVRTLEHANSLQFHILHESFLKPISNWQLSLHQWISSHNRQIPPARFEPESGKTEQQWVGRHLIKAERKNRHWQHQITGGAIWDRFDYQDTLIRFRNQLTSLALPLQYTIQYHFHKNHRIQFQSFNQYARILNQDSATLYRSRIELTYTRERIFGFLDFRTGIQQEWTNRFSLPWTGFAGFSTHSNKILDFYIQMAKRYRTPTLNELFFNPGGNPALKPEISRQFETGILLRKQYSSWLLLAEAHHYQRLVNQWIVWYGSSILTPRNIQEVYSRGFEYKLDLQWTPQPAVSYKQNKSTVQVPATDVCQISAGVLYAYTLSTTRTSDVPNDYSIGRQIPYVPRYQARIYTGIRYKRWDARYWHTYTGYRFVTTDESQFLLPYQTGNISLSCRLIVQQYPMQFMIRVQNMWDTHYESIVGRVMPGRYIVLGCLLGQ